jgi:hypothetical protein
LISPSTGITWNWQLEWDNAPTYNVSLYDVDLYAAKDYIQQLKNEGKHVICYFSAGYDRASRIAVTYCCPLD